MDPDDALVCGSERELGTFGVSHLAEISQQVASTW